MVELQKKIEEYKHMMSMLDQKRHAIAELVTNLEGVITLEHKTKNILDGDKDVKSEPKAPTKPSKKRAKGKGKMIAMSDLKEPMSLPALSLQIVKQSNKPLTVQEVAQKALDSGYRTSAKSFANNVYQSLNKHVRNKHISQQTVDGQIKFSA